MQAQNTEVRKSYKTVIAVVLIGLIAISGIFVGVGGARLLSEEASKAIPARIKVVFSKFTGYYHKNYTSEAEKEEAVETFEDNYDMVEETNK